MTDRLEPKFFSALKEGYNLSRLKADALAGLTVAIVALPLSMAIAISSGVTPERGLYTAIFGGFVVSLLGGSRFQIGGPAGAFIVLVAACVARNGVEGLILATMMSGLFLVAVGFLRLGKYIKYIPYPVTVGFTAGIGVIIFSGEIHDLFGLTTQGKEPGPLVDKLIYLSGYIGTINAQATAIAGLTIAVILMLKRFLPNWPGLLIAVGLSSVLAATLGLNVETIGTRFGGIPDAVPLPKLPTFSPDLIVKVLPDAIAFTLLGAIESLLSAVVADGMSGRRHRSSMELIGQGVANITSGLFGGFCVTGTIARTATNVRAGATSPVSGMLHAVFLLVFLLVAAPLARYIPLAALAGVLAFVCYNMIEQQAIAALFRSSWGDAVVLSATFLVVTFRDLTEGILVGFVLGAFLFIERMAKHVQVSEQPGDLFADDSEGPEKPFRTTDPDTAVYRISGVFFFGAAATVASVLDRIADTHRNFILDCSSVPFMDSSAANVIEGAVRKAHKNGVRVLIAGASPDARAILEANHVKAPAVEYFATFKEAAAAVHLQPPRFDAATARA